MRVIAIIASVVGIALASGAHGASPTVRLTTHRATPCEQPCSRAAVILIHGITGSKETWGDPNTQRYWPKILAADTSLGNGIDIYQIEYDSSNFSGPPALAIEQGIERELDKLMVSKQYEKVIFVAHSLGGIFVRTYLAHVKLAYGHAALNRIRLIITLGTPNEGADLANFARLLSQNEHLRVLRPIQVNDFQQFLNHSLADIKAKHEPCASLKSYAAYEEATVPGLGVIVSKQSAIQGADDSKGFPRNHIQLPKPASTVPPDEVYKWATDFVRQCIANSASVCPVFRATEAPSCPGGDFRSRNPN